MSFKTINEVQTYIRKIFGTDIAIRDAVFPLRIQPLPKDADGANPKDPSNCFYVHTVARMYQSQMVLFWKSVAYVDMLDSDGIRRVHRFLIPKDAMARIEKFDKGEPFPAGAAITLMPPTKGNTIGANKQRRVLKKKQFVDRRKVLQTNLKQHEKAMVQAATKLKAAMANEKQDAKKIAAITKAKERAEASVKKVQIDLSHMDTAKSKRAPKKFDLTTRNGAVGNYHFSGLATS